MRVKVISLVTFSRCDHRLLSHKQKSFKSDTSTLPYVNSRGSKPQSYQLHLYPARPALFQQTCWKSNISQKERNCGLSGEEIISILGDRKKTWYIGTAEVDKRECNKAKRELQKARQHGLPSVGNASMMLSVLDRWQPKKISFRLPARVPMFCFRRSRFSAQIPAVRQSFVKDLMQTLFSWNFVVYRVYRVS